MRNTGNITHYYKQNSVWMYDTATTLLNLESRFLTLKKTTGKEAGISELIDQIAAEDREVDKVDWKY